MLQPPIRSINVVLLADNFLDYGGGEIFFIELFHHLYKCNVHLRHLFVANQIGNYPPPTLPITHLRDAKLNFDEIDVLLVSGRHTRENMDLFNKIPVKIMIAHSDYNVNWYLDPVQEYINATIAVSSRTKDAINMHPCKAIIPGLDWDNYKSTVSRQDCRKILGFSDDEFLLGSFGRMAPSKNTAWVIDAVKLLPKQCKLLLIGYGPHLATMIQYAELVIPGRFQHLYYYNILSASNFYEAIDCFCLPAKGEGAPRVLWESLYHNVPFLGTPVGIIPEVIRNGINGFLVNSVEELSDSILKVVAGQITLDETEMHSLAITQGNIIKTAKLYANYLHTCIAGNSVL
jgi:glycosyltransferase involved in cell wall biosynthesis